MCILCRPDFALGAGGPHPPSLIKCLTEYEAGTSCQQTSPCPCVWWWIVCWRWFSLRSPAAVGWRGVCFCRGKIGPFLFVNWSHGVRIYWRRLGMWVSSYMIIIALRWVASAHRFCITVVVPLEWLFRRWRLGRAKIQKVAGLTCLCVPVLHCPWYIYVCNDAEIQHHTYEVAHLNTKCSCRSYHRRADTYLALGC